MTQLNPSKTTAGDIATAALLDCGAWGTGQTPLVPDILDAQARLQWLLQQWERKRWFVWNLQTFGLACTGQTAYSIGPGGDFDTNAALSPYNDQFGSGQGPGSIGQAGEIITGSGYNPFGPTFPVSVRPDKIESCFVRQLTQSQPNFIDYPMKIIQAREDYNRIALKQLQTFPGYVFYDTAWPLGYLFPWPVPQSAIYGLFVSIKNQLPPMFATLSVPLNIPYEYYRAMVKNLALELRAKYQIHTYPGDPLPGQAKDSLRVLRGANTQIGTLQMPGDLVRPQLYNIFSDRNY